MAAGNVTESKKPFNRRIALAFPTRLAHLHTVVQGIADYAHAHGRWVFTTAGEANDLPMRAIKGWRGDGIIASLGTEADARAARRTKIPVVTFLAMVKNPGVPRVMMDQAAIGRLAAEHLLSKGFRKFAFYGVADAGYSTLREREFFSRLTQGHFSVNRHFSPNMLEGEQRWDDAISGLVKWIRKLPLPIGIFAVSDARARMIADACEIVGRKVPEQVGIIGVDNNHFDCELGSPQLTTIECDWWRVGYQAAELLDRLMSETTTKLIEQLIPPTGVIERESTDVTIVDHPAVAKAVAFAKAHQGQCFGVKALVTAAGVSRRYLETSFARALHRTPAQYLAEMRVQRAKSLLSLKSMSLSRIAKESGFSDLRQFRRVFTRLQKRSPSAHRKSLTRPARPITGHT